MPIVKMQAQHKTTIMADRATKGGSEFDRCLKP